MPSGILEVSRLNMKKTTTFTWGYYGWGNHTPPLVEAVEGSRGFQSLDPDNLTFFP